MTDFETYYKQAYKREKLARKEAEKILEVKSLELYEANAQLTHLNNNLEEALQNRLNQIKRVEKEFRSFVEKATDIIYRLDIKGDFTYINPKGLEVFEYSKSEIIGKNFTEFIHPSHIKRISLLFEQQIDKKLDSTYYEYKVLSKTGEVIWLGQNLQLIQNETGIKEIISVARNITERKELEKVILQSEKKYRGILENLDFGLIEVDLDETITKAYPSFTNLTGYKSKEVIGKSPYDFLHPNHREKIIARHRKRNRKHSEVYEVQIQKKDGDYIWVIISRAPFYDTDGKELGSVSIHLDITERKTMEEDLKRANQFAMASSKSKELFLANMSHEIRTPLNAVIGLSSLLRKTVLDKEQENYTENISKSANSLLLLVNDILDISKIESGKLEIHKSPFLLQDLLEKIQASVSYTAEQKQLKLYINIDPVLEDYYSTDELRLTQILINLTNNAIKFTDYGKVAIQLEMVKKETAIHHVKISVIDTGKGIPKERLHKIFQDFEQENSKIAGRYGGTGLGLSISKKLVELLGGQLEVSSKLHHGSTFYFTLPLEKVDKVKQDVTTNKNKNGVDWKTITFLIAEDNPVNQLVIESTLQHWGAKTDIANNGEEALKKLKQKDYDIILMDVQMPIMDGLTTSKVIRRSLKKTTPIIALTANAFKKDIDKCLKAGMNAYVPKPFKEDLLKNTILQFIDNKTSIETEKHAMPKLLTLDRLEDISRGNPEFITKMLTIFIKTAENELQNLKQTENIEEIGRIAHKIKPSIDHLSTENYQQLVRLIEGKKFVTEPELLEDFIHQLELLIQECKEALL